jgi:hypothetical protein
MSNFVYNLYTRLYGHAMKEEMVAVRIPKSLADRVDDNARIMRRRLNMPTISRTSAVAVLLRKGCRSYENGVEEE